MPDIFMSYSRENRPIAQKLVAALEAGGCSVWWDGLLEGGERFSRKTAAALEKADVVVVLWSKTSVESHWVHDEATHGRDKGRLVPVSIDGSEAPLGFRQFQVLDLAHWKGKADAPEIADVLRAIGIAAGQPDLVPRPVPAIATPTTRRNLILAGGGAALVAAGGGTAAWQWGLFEPAGVANSVAVLPFKNLSGDPGQDYFAEGLAEEIRSALTRNPLLQVAAPTSSGMFRDGALSVPEIAKKLGVAYVLDGSVRRAGPTVRIGAQLISGKTGLMSWSRTFDRSFDDLLATQAEIAGTVTSVLDAQVGGRGIRLAAEAKSNTGGTINPAAFDAYLRGKAQFDQYADETSIDAALVAFDEALALDPKYAAARAGRAKALTMQATWLLSVTQTRDRFALAITEAEQAVAIAPQLGDAQSALGFAKLYGRLSLKEAREPYEYVHKFGWGDASALMEYAHFRSLEGDVDSAMAAINRAVVLDPLNARAFKMRGTILYNARQFPDAITAIRKALLLAPKIIGAFSLIGNAQLMLGKLREAKSSMASEVTEYKRLADLAIIDHLLGSMTAAQQAMELLVEKYGNTCLYQQAQILGQWGLKDRAIDALELGHSNADSGLVAIGTDPILDPLRKEPRFIRLYNKMGFEQGFA